MDFGSILNQVLSATQQSASTVGRGNSLNDLVAKIGGGTALAGLSAVLLGRNLGGKALKIGSLGALGAVAYKALQNFQANAKQNKPNLSALSETDFQIQNNNNSAEVLLKAMIAAACADGVIDEQEKVVLREQIGSNEQLLAWVNNELNNPATPAQLAQLCANNPALASQVYLSARLTCGELENKEVVFLARLAEQLGLDENLVSSLDKEIGF